MLLSGARPIFYDRNAVLFGDFEARLHWHNVFSIHSARTLLYDSRLPAQYTVSLLGTRVHARARICRAQAHAREWRDIHARVTSHAHTDQGGVRRAHAVAWRCLLANFFIFRPRFFITRGICRLFHAIHSHDVPWDRRGERSGPEVVL